MAENNQQIQSGTRGNSAALRLHITGRTKPTFHTSSGIDTNSSRTYELNTGSKTYTLSQKQYDGLRQIYKSTWADAYAFDDEDQQRKAAGLVPRSYAQNYKNNNLDNWLLENELPSAKYLDKYLEAYGEYEAEQQAYQNKAKAKSSLYENAARASVNLELQGIYNDDKKYDWNGEKRTGRDIHADAFFDLVGKGDYGDAYVFDNSALDKEKTDFETTAEWREYQLRQAAKSFDQQKDWDDATSISYNDYLQNYSASLDKQLKAQKVVGDAMGRTWGEYAEDQATDREKAAYGALKTDAALDKFVAGNQDAPADVIAKMYEYGVDQGKIKRAKNQFVKKAATDEDKKVILDAFTSGKQARKEAEQQAREQQQTAKDGVRAIFNKTAKYDGGGADADSLTQAVEAAREAGYSAEDIASTAADLRRELAQGGMLNLAANGVLRDAVHPERKANADADAVVKSVQESYAQSTTELSPVSAEQAASLILSNLEYQGNRVTDESVQAGMDAAIASGASYAVLREAADMALNLLERARTVDNGGSRVSGAYTGDFTTREIMDNALASAKKEDETLLAAATRKALEEKGYTAFEIDQTFRRNGWSGLLDDEEAARNYFIDVALPREAEADPNGWGEALGDMTPEQYATLYWNNMTDEERAEYVASFKESAGYNTDLHRTHGEQAIAQFAMIVPRVLTGIASGAVNLADMTEGIFSGRTDRWEASKALSEANAFTQNLGRSANQDAASDIIAGANDVATEVLRMYTLNAAGSGLAKAFSGIGTATAAVPGAATTSAAVAGASSKGLGKMLDLAKKMFSAQSAPFIATSMGGYYAEAMESGATREQATLYGLIAGTAEGALESLNVDNWINNRIGGGRFIKQVQAAGRNALRQGYTNGMKVIGLASSALGEGAEEGASYLISTLMRKATFDPNAEISGSELLEQAFMGALIGVFGAGAAIAGNPQAYTETGILYNYLAENGYDANVADALLASVQYDLMDANTRATAVKNPAALSIEDYRSHMTTIEQAGKAMETAEKNLRSAIENGKSDMEARRAAVLQLVEELSAINAGTVDGAKRMAGLSAELTAARGRLANAVATSNSTVQKARDARDASYVQNQRAIKKARAELNRHFVTVRNLLRPEIEQLRTETKNGDTLRDLKTRASALVAGSEEERARLQAAIDNAKSLPELHDALLDMEQSRMSLEEMDADVAALDAGMGFTRDDLLNDIELAMTTGDAELYDWAQGMLDDIDAAIADKMAAIRAGVAQNDQTAAETVSVPDGAIGASVANSGVRTGSNASYADVSDGSKQSAIAIGERLGIPVVFEQMPEGKHGFYENGIIHINTRLPEGETPEMVVLRHELTHFIESGNGYTEFSNFVFQIAQQLDKEVNINSVLKGYITEYGARGIELTLDGARREFVANFVQNNLFKDPASIDALVREQSGFAGRVLNWIQYRIAKLKLRGQNSAEARAMLDAERMYVKAFAKAGKNPSSGVRQYAIGYTTDNTPFVEIEEDILAGVPQKNWRTVLNDTIRARFKNGITVGGQTVAVTGKTRKEMRGSKDTQYLMMNDTTRYGVKVRSVANLDEVIKASRGYVGEERSHDRTDDIVEFARGNVLVKVGGKPYKAEVLIATLQDGGMRLHDIVNIEEGYFTERTKNQPPNAGPEMGDPRTPAAGGENANASLATTIAYAENGGQVPNSENSQNSIGLSWQEMIDKYGAKDTGMNPRERDEAVPERASDTQRVSDFIRSFVESDKATVEMVEEVKAAVENGDFGVYAELPNKQLQQRAQNTISFKGVPKAQEDFSEAVRNGRINKDTGALGLQLIAEASKRGDSDSMMQLVADMAVYSTETGQATQALSMLKKMGGVGSAYYLQKVEDRMNAKYEKQIVSGKMLPVKIDGSLMQQLAMARTTEEITTLEDAIATNLNAQLPLSLQQKMSNWRYFSMLANPTTHIRNVTGNGLMAGVRSAKDVVATGIERAFVRDESKRAHAVYSKRAQADKVAYAETSFEANKRDLMSGGKYGFETFLKQNQRLFDNKTLNKLGQLNFAALEGEDAIFLKSAYKDAMVQYLVAQNLDPANLTPKQEAAAVKWASEEAQRATFRDASTLASYLNKLSNMNTGTKVLMEGVMPFKKTPINIAKRGIEYSPIGIIEGVYQLTAGVKSGKYTVAQGIDRLSAGLTGTGLMALGALLAKWGILRGGEDDEKYESFLGASGEQGYSLNIGDVSIDISGLAPATIPLFMGVSFMEAISKEEAFDMSMLVDTLTSVADPLMEMSFMSSLNAAIESYSQDGVGGALGNVAWNAASSYASQYVPTFTGKIGQFADPTTRTTKSDATSVLGGTMDSFLRSVVKKVPGAEATLESYVDVWGRTQEKTTWQEWALDFFNKFVSPANVKVKNRDAVDNELIRLVEATGETGFLPSTGRKYFTVDGERYTMDAKQYTAYSMERGQAIYAAVKRVMNTSGYQAANDAKKVELLDRAVDNATTTVNDKYKELLGAFDK